MPGAKTSLLAALSGWQSGSTSAFTTSEVMARPPSPAYSPSPSTVAFGPPSAPMSMRMILSMPMPVLSRPRPFGDFPCSASSSAERRTYRVLCPSIALAESNGWHSTSPLHGRSEAFSSRQDVPPEVIGVNARSASPGGGRRLTGIEPGRDAVRARDGSGRDDHRPEAQSARPPWARRQPTAGAGLASRDAAPASATALSSSTLLPLTPIAPMIAPWAFFSGRPPGNVISPSFENSMW